MAEGTVSVTVEGIRSDNGVVHVELCTQAEGLRRRCRFDGTGTAHVGDVVVKMDGIPAGTYAAWAWHDENGSGRLNHDILGLPIGGVGYSRDAAGVFGPPAFDKASFDVDAKGGQATARLHYHRR